MAGQYFDAETGLHYNYHRYYDPATGRYITPDPIGLAGGINLYGYAGLNPVNAIDPHGLTELVLPRYYIPRVIPKAWPKVPPNVLIDPYLIPNPNLYYQEVKPEDVDMEDTETWPESPSDSSCKEGEPSRKKPRERGEKSLYDDEGGEWRIQKPDKHHPEMHWNYKPPGKNAPWKNIPLKPPTPIA